MTLHNLNATDRARRHIFALTLSALAVATTDIATAQRSPHPGPRNAQTTAATHAGLKSSAPARYVVDYTLLVASIGAVSGVLSLVVAFFADRRAARDEIRLRNAEERISTEEEIRRRSALYLMQCETAAGEAREIENRSHPEWKQLSVALIEGRHSSSSIDVIFIKANYQSRPHVIGEKTHAMTWYKWYIGVEALTDIDILAIFGQLPNLLRRPGDLQFELQDAVPAWVRQEIGEKRIVGLLYGRSSTF